MQPIPKELQNQKAIPFMEWCNNAIILYRKTYGNDNEIDIFKIKRILDFYNQPFTPEMLQEYFEGWEENDNDEWVLGKPFERTLVYYQTELTKQNTLTRLKPIREDISSDDDRDMWWFDTLNDFIMLSTLAGKELTWKGE
jgi:hypothetical protein